MDNDFRKTLKKKERLSVGTDLSRLFASGRYGITDGFRYCYRIGNGLPFNRIVVSVPKKCFRRAVKRNLLKRRIREAYRLNKNLLPVNAEKGGTDIIFIYRTKDILDFGTIVLSVRNILESLAAKVTAMDTTPKYSPGETINEAPNAAQKDSLEAGQQEAPNAAQKDALEAAQQEAPECGTEGCTRGSTARGTGGGAEGCTGGSTGRCTGRNAERDGAATERSS